MKRRMIAIVTELFALVPTVVLADFAGGDPTPGCGYLSTDINSIVGTALVGIAVGIVVRSRRP